MPIELIAPEVARYLEALVPPRPAELEAMEAEAGRSGFPIIGPTAGYFCYLVTRLSGARKVFELGSGFGYSTAWFARGVLENGGGTVHHTVWDAALSERARGHLKTLGLGDQVEYHVGEAVDTLRKAPGQFDLIFNDIDKADYPTAVPVIYAKLRKGGVLIVDNLLWGGKVLDAKDRSSGTTGVRELTRLVMDQSQWIASLVPIRDGLLLATKK
jgi:predicted O-methyltransferase YrrM